PDGSVDAPPDSSLSPVDPFARRYGGYGDESLTGLALTSDGYVFGGGFYDKVNFGGGGVAAQSAKGALGIPAFANNSAFAWAAPFGSSPATTLAKAIATFPNGDVAFCGTWGGKIDWGSGLVTSTNQNSGDIVIGKLGAANGKPVWAHPLMNMTIKDCVGVAV